MKIMLRGNAKEFEAPMTALEIDASISHELKKEAVAAKIDGEVKDLKTVIDHDCEVEFLTFADEEGRRVYRHTASHVLAQAVKALYPDAKLAIGPAIDNGFYRVLYDRRFQEDRKGNGARHQGELPDRAL